MLVRRRHRAHVEKRKAAAEATQKFGITISASTVFRASEKPGQRPRSGGGTVAYYQRGPREQVGGVLPPAARHEAADLL